MLLTDKAKEDFLIHLKETRRCNEKSFSEFPAIFEDALIIEWLDSVGIYVWTIPSARVETKWTFRIFKDLFTDIKQRAYIYKTRSEATQKAILKANEIYNNLNNKQDEK